MQVLLSECVPCLMQHEPNQEHERGQDPYKGAPPETPSPESGLHGLAHVCLPGEQEGSKAALPGEQEGGRAALAVCLESKTVAKRCWLSAWVGCCMASRCMNLQTYLLEGACDDCWAQHSAAGDRCTASYLLPDSSLKTS